MSIFSFKRPRNNLKLIEDSAGSNSEASEFNKSPGIINNLRAMPEFISLAEMIREKAHGRKVIYAPSYGNWGDALIQQGTIQFLKDNGIAYTTLTRPKIDMLRETIAPSGMDLSDAILLSCGGGSWCKNYHGNRDFVNRNHDLFAETIVLPSTYELPSISDGKPNVTYVARDKSESQMSIEDSIFCHDMAFYIQLPKPVDVASVSDTGYFFRQDSEKNQFATAFGPGYDISLVGNQNSKISPFFHILNGYTRIITVRMHVAIAGAMLGKEVELYAGDYFKAKAVFESSIEHSYPNVSLRSWKTVQ